MTTSPDNNEVSVCVDAASVPRERLDGTIKLYGPEAFAGMRRAGPLTTSLLDELVEPVRPGVTTGALDDHMRARAVLRRYRPRDPASGRTPWPRGGPRVSRHARYPALRKGGRGRRAASGDDWTKVTPDRSLSAQLEHSIGITETGREIFTRSPRRLDRPPYVTPAP